jgi:hypothetical protein
MNHFLNENLINSKLKTILEFGGILGLGKGLGKLSTGWI